MRVIGYCTGCHRVKTVNATAFFGAAGALPHGTCDACQEKADAKKH